MPETNPSGTFFDITDVGNFALKKQGLILCSRLRAVGILENEMKKMRIKGLFGRI